MRLHDLLVAQRAELLSRVHHWWHSKSGTALSAPQLLDAFAEEESEAASFAPWRRQLWLALGSFVVLVLGSAANSWLGALAAVLRRRQQARVAARGWVEQPDEVATAVRPWPVRQGDVQADAGASSWADAAALVGSWTLDPGASDSPEPLHALLGYGWAERLAASCLTRLAVEEEEEENEGTVWRLGVHAEGMVLSGAALDERYPQDGSAVVLPRRDASRWSDSGEALESATACAVPRDGGVQLVHLLGAPRAGTLREWLGVTVEEDGREALVRQTQLRLKGGLGEWEGISVYRRLEEPQQGLPDAASAPSGAVAAPGALRMAARRRRRSAGGVDDVDNTPLGDELAFRSEQQFEQALRRAIKPQREAHELESPPALQSEQQSGGEMDAVEEIVTAAPAPLVAMADALLDNLPRMFGGFRSREATQAERAALTAVALGSMRLGVERQSEQTVELTAPTPVVSAKPMLPGSERAELAAWLELRRR